MKPIALSATALVFAIQACSPTPPAGQEVTYWAGREAMNARDTAAYNQALAALVQAGGTDARAHCLADLLVAASFVAVPKPQEAITIMEKAEPLARDLFGAYSKVHCDALAQYNYARGYAGDLDGELNGTQALMAFYQKAPDAHGLEIAECLNVIGMNYGLRGDHLTEMRLQQKGLDMVLHRPPGVDDPDAMMNAEWTLRNSLANAASSIGDHENARHSAKRCKAILGSFAPQAAENSISDQIIARSFWCVDGDLDSSLRYINSAITRLAQDSARGVGSGQWLSYTAYKCEYLVQAGHAAEAVSLTEQALPHVKDSLFGVGVKGESMFKLLVNRGFALLANGDLTSTAVLVDRLHAGLPQVALQRDVLAMLTADLELRLLERTGDSTRAERLIDSMTTKYDLTNTTGQQVNRAAINPVFLRTFMRFGEYRLHRAEAHAGTPNGTAALERAISLLEPAVRLQRADHDLLLNSGGNNNSAPDQLDATALLLKAYWLADTAGAPAVPPTAIAATLSGGKARLLDQQLRVEKGYAQVLAPAEEDERLLLRARVFSAINDYMNQASGSNATAVLNARTAYDVDLEELRAKYPVLAAREATPTLCDAMEVARTENAVILDYYLGDDDLFILRTDQNGQRFFRRDVPPELLGSIARFRQEALNAGTWAEGHTPAPEVQAYPAAWKVLLLDGILDTSTTAAKLIVIPHMELSLVNFEFLPGFKGAGHYLIEDMEVRSALSFFQLCGANGAITGDMLRVGGFSATEFSDDPDMDEEVKAMASRGGLSDLKGTAAETDSIAALFQGEHYAHATASDFLAHAGEFNVLHVGTHGIIHQNGSGTAYLLFEGENSWADRVTHAQVAGMDLPCELVVLSACNTSLGKLHGGEGAASLSRAFFQAGSRSVVSSLWQVPDERTSDIMIGFYGYLKEGMSRSAALRKAKLDHLDRFRSNVQHNPYFWGGFVLFGADGPIEGTIPGKGMNWSWVLSSVIALLVAYFFSKRRRMSPAR